MYIIFNLMRQIDKANYSIIIRYILLYWTVFAILGIVCIIYDLIIYLVRWEVLFRIYIYGTKSVNIDRIRYVSELYYIFDKFLSKISLGIIKISYNDENHFRKIGETSPIAILNFIKKSLIKMITLDIYNITIWAILVYYFNPNSINQCTQLIYNFNISKLIEIIQNFKLNKISNDLWGIIMIIISFLSGSGIKFSSKINEKKDDKKIEEICLYQRKIEDILGKIVRIAEENIDLYSRQIKYFADWYCEILTGTGKYKIENGKLGNYENILESRLTVDDIINNYNSLDDLVGELNTILNEINEKDLKSVFKEYNKPLMYEFYRIGLHSPLEILKMKHNFFSKEDIKSFLINWTQNKQLKDQFIKLSYVWFNEISKEDLEKEYNKNVSYNYSFTDIVMFAENRLEKDANEFGLRNIFNLREAVNYYILVNQYYKKSIERKKRLMKIDFIKENFVNK